MTPTESHNKRLALASSRTWIDIAVLTALALIGLLGFAVSFTSGLYLVAGLGGLVIGTAAAIAASTFRLGPLLSALVAVAAYFIFGSGFAMPTFATLGVLPSTTTLSGLAVGAVFGWTDIVTLNTPVAAPDYIGVLPYVTTWIVGVVSTTIATRWFATRRRTPLSSLLALIAPTALYVFSVLSGTDVPVLAPVRGVAFAVIALVWMAWRVPESSNVTLGSANGLLRQKLMGVGMVVAVAVVGGTLVGAAAAPENRFVLRDKITPPFEVQNYASPLAGFRSFTKDTSKDPLFTVTGLQKGDRIQIAAMDSYNGVVWNVTAPDADPSQSGVFDLVGGKLNAPATGRSNKVENLTVTVGRYQDYWIPSSGYARSIDFTKQAPDSADVRYNPQTGILIDTAAVHSGQKYQLTVDQYDVDVKKLQKAADSPNVPTPISVPPTIAAAAVKFAGDGKTEYDKLKNIEAAFVDDGIFSHGLTSDAAPSIAGHSEWRLTELLKPGQMIGDQEQFAAAFALMANSLKYPSRVVMGFEKTVTPGQPTTFTAQDVTAWPEVEFAGIGWVRFDPKPIKTSAPDVTPTKPKEDPLPQSKQPDNANLNQSNLVSPTEVDKSKRAPEPFQLPEWIVPVAVSVGIPLALYFIPLLIVAAIKRRRRRRRRTGPTDRQAAGAWDELVDVYAELGYRAPRRATRVQSALLFEEQFRDELEARERERSDAATRASNRAARAEARAAAKGQPASGGSTASGLVGGAMARLKDASTWRPGVAGQNDALPVLPGLREFAVAADEAVFSGDEVAPETVDRLWSDLGAVQDAGRGSVSWIRRRLSAFRVRSRRDAGRAFAARMAAASTPKQKVATR